MGSCNAVSGLLLATAALVGVMVGISLLAIFQQRVGPPFWLPSRFQRVWNYGLALKTLAWYERKLSSFVETWTKIPILTVSGATGAWLSKCRVGWTRADTLRRALKEFLTTPPRRGQGSSAKLISEDDLPVRRLNF